MVANSPKHIPLEELVLEPISESNIPSHFDCGDKDLNEFLLEDALEHENQQLTRTTLAFHKNKLLGYFSLSSDCIALTWGERKKHFEVQRIKQYPEYPAIKIARLAVCESFQKNGIGKILVYVVIGLAEVLREKVGVRFISVDAYPKSKGFYEKLFFLPNNHNTEVYVEREGNKEKRQTISMRRDLRPTFYNPYQDEDLKNN